MIFKSVRCPSPDGSGILFLSSLERKRYSGQPETAPDHAANKKSRTKFGTGFLYFNRPSSISGNWSQDAF
ncbi:MAG: hypothetical protein CFE23_08680 [Flavobacterium sp. BFFFF1]|nr:MAG: hypothetical protein CFE23_08680 [Flavobacterium sp. BFFFF1]